MTPQLSVPASFPKIQLVIVSFAVQNRQVALTANAVLQWISVLAIATLHLRSGNLLKCTKMTVGIHILNLLDSEVHLPWVGQQSHGDCCNPGHIK